MLVPKLLLDTLNDMGKNDFESFRWFLSQENILDGCNPIPWGIIEKADRTEVVAKMTTRYGNDLAVKISIELLKLLEINSVADKLRNKYDEGLKAASCSTTSAAATPATAGPSLSAMGGSIIVAPTISSDSTIGGNVNISITTPQQK